MILKLQVSDFRAIIALLFQNYAPFSMYSLTIILYQAPGSLDLVLTWGTLFSFSHSGKVLFRVENIMRKGEIAFDKQFSFSHNVFNNYISLLCQNAVLYGNWLTLCHTIQNFSNPETESF